MRRLTLMLIAFLSLAVATPGPADDAKQPSPAKPALKYMRETVPAFTIPPYRGEHYSDMVPDTLDLAERARLAVHGLTAPTDPAYDHDIYFLTNFYHNPPLMRHQFSDICIVKYWEALPLLRLASGSTLNENVDRVWMESILKSIGPDGLYYNCIEGRPWLQDEDMYAWCPNVCWPDGTISGPKGKKFEAFNDSVILGRILAALTIYALRDENPLWDQTMKRMVDRMKELCIDKGDYAYLAARLNVPGAKPPANAPMATGLMAEELGGRLIQGLAQYYRVSKYEPARELAGKLVKYLKDHAMFYDEQGRFISPDAQGKPAVGGHFHGHTIGLLSFLDYALVAKDKDLLTFVNQSYLWARDHGYGSSLIGWFPEGVQANYPNCELCCVADMVALALKLSEAGAGDYWDDADRWIRNCLAEGQWIRMDWIGRLAATLPKKPLSANETDEDVTGRNVGSFTGYITGNEYGIKDGGPTGVAACCAGNASRTLYYAWETILDYDRARGALRVNLLLNRASKWADVYSHIPYAGQVDLKIKQDLKAVRVRVPQWIKTGGAEVVCKVNDAPVKFSWSDRFIVFGELHAKDTLTIRFPLSERTVSEHIGNKDYTLVIKGNDVVFIDPPGQLGRLYQRDHYRDNYTRWHQVERFVSAETIEW